MILLASSSLATSPSVTQSLLHVHKTTKHVTILPRFVPWECYSSHSTCLAKLRPNIMCFLRTTTLMLQTPLIYDSHGHHTINTNQDSRLIGHPHISKIIVLHMLHTLKLMVRDQEFLSQRKPYPQTSSVLDQNYPNLTRTTPKSGVKNAINYSINFITTCVPQTCNMYMPPKSPMMAIKHITIFNPIQNNPTCLRISPQ